MRQSSLVLCIALMLLAGCKRNQSEPRYCNQDLSGAWVNSTDEAFAYRLNDHGDVVRGKFFHRQPDGGEAAPDPGRATRPRAPAASRRRVRRA